MRGNVIKKAIIDLRCMVRCRPERLRFSGLASTSRTTAATIVLSHDDVVTSTLGHFWRPYRAPKKSLAPDSLSKLIAGAEFSPIAPWHSLIANAAGVTCA